MIVIGTVVRLQVQSDRLKPGKAPTRRYDPSPLREVPALEVSPRGVVGLTGDRAHSCNRAPVGDPAHPAAPQHPAAPRQPAAPRHAGDPAHAGGERILDGHHADHTATRNVRLANGLSLLPRLHYARLRETYGPHLVDGSAGESVLLDTAESWGPDALRGDLWLETDDGRLELAGARPAAPCLEFSQYALGREPGDAGPEVLAALADLDHGARGFYANATETGVVRVGARLWRA